MIQQTGIDNFLSLAMNHPVLDVRSPGEYHHAHIPGSYNLPLFSDEERKVVGTIYKEQGREQAIKKGLEYFGVKMSGMVEAAEVIVKEHTSQMMNLQEQISDEPGCVLVHCWRGGMRSAGVAWLLDLYGFKVYTLQGGYKAFRNWALQRFELPYNLKIIGGYTGSGKTEIIKELQKTAHAVIDLEAIARHKGSAFGGLGEEPQPTQEMFENELAWKLHNLSGDFRHIPVWIEDESRRIGSVNLPDKFWETMLFSPVYFIEVPFEHRLDHITEVYGQFKKEELISAVMRIQKRLGGLNTKDAVNFLLEDNFRESFRILLNYYDKYYQKGFLDREGVTIRVACEKVDPEKNSILLDAQKKITDGITGREN